jgi:hypothetical protein
MDNRTAGWSAASLIFFTGSVFEWVYPLALDDRMTDIGPEYSTFVMAGMFGACALLCAFIAWCYVEIDKANAGYLLLAQRSNLDQEGDNQEQYSRHSFQVFLRWVAGESDDEQDPLVKEGDSPSSTPSSIGSVNNDF